MKPAVLTVEVDYHQFFLAPFGISPVYDGIDAGPVASVVEAGTALIVSTGCASGVVVLEISLLAEAPPGDGTWEAQESVSVWIREPLYLTAPTHGFALGADGSPWRLAPRTPGPHRVRVGARGRGSNPDSHVMGGPSGERYRLQIWPDSRLRARETTLDDGFGIGS